MQGDFVKRIFDFYRFFSDFIRVSFLYICKKSQNRTPCRTHKKNIIILTKLRCMTKRNKNGAHASGYEGILL